MSVNEKLLTTRFVVDSGSPHITVNTSACTECLDAPCLVVCPVQCFQRERQRLVFNYENCVECGSCRIICSRNALSWNYPRGGFGVCYRFG